MGPAGHVDFDRLARFIHGMELANAYTELNDPDLQEQLFAQQLEGQDEEDSIQKLLKLLKSFLLEGEDCSSN